MSTPSFAKEVVTEYVGGNDKVLITAEKVVEKKIESKSSGETSGVAAGGDVALASDLDRDVEEATGNRRDTRPLEVLEDVEVVHVSEIPDFGKSRSQAPTGRPKRFGKFDPSKAAKTQFYEKFQRKAREGGHHLPPWAVQDVFWVDIEDLEDADDREEIRLLNQWPSDNLDAKLDALPNGTLVRAICERVKFLAAYNGLPCMPNQVDLQGAIDLVFETPPHFRLTDLLGESKRLTSSGFNLDTLRLVHDSKLPALAERLGAHVLLDSAYVTDFAVSGFDYAPIEVALTSTAVAAVGNGSEEEAQLVDREITGTHRHARSFSTRTGTGTTHRVLLRQGELAEIIREKDPKDLCLAATHHTLFQNPWVARSMYMRFHALYNEIEAKTDKENWGGALVVLEHSFLDTALALDDPLLIIMFGSWDFLVAEFEAWKRAHLSELRAKGDNDAAQKLQSVNYAQPHRMTLRGADATRLTVVVVKKSLLKAVQELEAETHQADTLLNLNRLGFVARVPSELKKDVKMRMNALDEERDSIDQNPFVSVRMNVRLRYARVPNNFGKLLTTPVVKGDTLTSGAFHLLRGQVDGERDYINTDYFGAESSLLHHRIEEKLAEDTATNNAIQVAAAIAGIPEAAVVETQTVGYWKKQAFFEYLQDLSQNLSRQEIVDKAELRWKGAPADSTEKKVRALFARQLKRDAAADYSPPPGTERFSFERGQIPKFAFSPQQLENPDVLLEVADTVSKPVRAEDNRKLVRKLYSKFLQQKLAGPEIIAAIKDVLDAQSGSTFDDELALLVSDWSKAVAKEQPLYYTFVAGRPFSY